MSNYIQGSLIGGEQVIYTAALSKWSVAGLIGVGGFFVFSSLLSMAGPNKTVSFSLFCFGAVLLISAYLRLATTELAVTNKRVIAKFGFISRQTIELNVKKVESMQVHQGIFGRMFNYGSLVISGAGNPQAPISGISRPLDFRKAFMEVQDRSDQTL